MAGVASNLAKKRALAAGFGTNSNAVKYSNQDFEALRSQCLSQGKLFTDPTFSAAPESLGFNELGPNSSKTRGVVWKRPGVSFFFFLQEWKTKMSYITLHAFVVFIKDGVDEPLAHACMHAHARTHTHTHTHYKHTYIHTAHTQR